MDVFYIAVDEKDMSKVTFRVRVPVVNKTERGLRRKRRTKKLQGGFLPLLAPIIAAAIGAIPGIASVALAASQKH
ncbi:pX [Polar bear adenovirus 1]|uniref:PX n=1 Tax=Polar bear adenovirus 1 TaxID=2250215 RepID=A0A2Z4QJC2_9ADEN|nr:pX [Polar bear adenovirus 1]AWY10562.1 pX [Polar bear adenovirus 1]AXI68657.1 pX [Polar bear adenovirus 1]